MATTMLNVYDMNRQKTAILQNAFGITETRELNKIYTLAFTIPATDEKVKYIQPFHYVRWGDDGELYRIINTELDDDETPMLKVNCEHVIATLVDDLMFGAVQYGGGSIGTQSVIRYLLDKQKTANWVLGSCDFDRRFEYNWEQENVLNALYSVPKEFATAYRWVFDTTVYPWKISLKTIDDSIHPEYYIRAKRNLLSSGTAQDFTGICTRIYPLGYGEGVNQLGIKEINNGVPYLQSPANIVAQYGIKEKILVDRRFENAEALKEYAQTMLDALQTPSMSRSFDVVDLYPLTNQNIDNADVGKICKMTGDDTIAYITKTTRVWDEPGNLEIELSTKATDVASSIADLADRVRIESVYAQGATQLYQHSKDANATADKGMVMSLYFPSEMRQINKVLMRLKLGKFRSYSKTTSSNGGFAQTYNVSSTSQTYSVGASEQTISVEASEQTYSVDKTEQTYSVAESSKEYSVAASSETVSVASSSETVSVSSSSQTVSVEKSEQTYSIDASKQNVTINLEATKTTDMSADNNKQNLTTTADGGTTSETDSQSASLSGSVSTEAAWEGADAYGYIEGSEQSTYFKTDHSNDYSSWTTGETTAQSGQPHTHTYYRLFDHYHEGYLNYAARIPKERLTHSHKVVLGGVAEHSHKFSLSPHSHAINIAHQHKYNISHSHTIPIPGHSHQITIPGHEHNITIPGHEHEITIPGHEHEITIPGHEHEITIPGHSHTITIPGHSHTITIPGHSHSITIPGHSHTITIPGHEHKITIPAHSHEITAGIFESGNATSFDIYIGNVKKATVNATNYDGDITQWLLNAQNQIPRNTWIDVEIRPNDLAYVQSSVFVQGFVQSRGGGNY